MTDLHILMMEFVSIPSDTVGLQTLPTLSKLQKVFDILLNITSGAAVVIGGIWTYYRFIKGRTFAPKLEPKISGEAKHQQNGIYLIEGRS
jgi:hypothetical protein